MPGVRWQPAMSRRAATLVEQAKAMNIAYGFHDDSPAKIEALIRKSTELTEIDGNRPATEAARRQRAEFLMEQSEQLLRWRAYDEAERLASDAIALRATFGPFDANPQALRDRIAADRKKQPPRTLPGGGTAGGGSAMTPPTVAEDAATLLAAPSPAEAKKQVLELTKMARSALAERKIDLADRLARQAEALQVPSTAFGPQEDRPALVILEVAKLRASKQGVIRAAGGAEAGPKYSVGQSIYDDQHDTTQNVQAGLATQPLEEVEPALAGDDSAESESVADGETRADALTLFKSGEQSLRDRNAEQALQFFRQAYALRDQLDPQTAQRLQDHLQLLSASPGMRQSAPKTLVESATAKQQLAIKQLHHEVVRKQEAARKITEKDPKRPWRFWTKRDRWSRRLASTATRRGKCCGSSE